MKDNPKALDNTINDLKIITGQTPIVTKAKKLLLLSKLEKVLILDAKLH